MIGWKLMGEREQERCAVHAFDVQSNFVNASNSNSNNSWNEDSHSIRLSWQIWSFYDYSAHQNGLWCGATCDWDDRKANQTNACILQRWLLFDSYSFRKVFGMHINIKLNASLSMLNSGGKHIMLFNKTTKTCKKKHTNEHTKAVSFERPQTNRFMLRSAHRHSILCDGFDCMLMKDVIRITHSL